MRNITLGPLLVLLALTASAQSVVVGTQLLGGTVSRNETPPYTLIDLSHPASADGTVTSASVRWNFKGCTGAFKLKFLRPSDPLALTTFTLIAERGPFTAQAGRNLLPVSPPVDVKAGDLIAVTSLVSFATCGCPAVTLDPGSVVMQIAGDIQSGAFSGTYERREALAVRATDSVEVLEGVIAAGGSLHGNFGSFFRTSLQIANTGGSTSTGKIVFHPAGVPASTNDQAYPYTVSSGNATSYTDIIQTMGQSGLGTIDVISTSGFPPLVTARIYNDAGANGTSGFTEDLITPAAALHGGDLAVLLTPADLTNFRTNIGVRTLSSAATINVQYGSRSQSNKDFPANTFQQFSLTGFGDTTPVPNEQIFFYVLSGDAIIYLSATDNRTNDSSVRFARRE
jgi:hypothetical protein